MTGNERKPPLVIFPGRTLVASAVGGAIGLGALAGLLLGIVAPMDVGATAASAGAGTTRSATPTANASATTGTLSSSSTSTTTTSASSEPAPNRYLDQPWNDPTLSLGVLVGVQQDSTKITIRVRSAKLLTGQAARDYLSGKGQQPQNLAVDTDGGHTARYVLRPDATIFVESKLNYNQQGRRQVSAQEFVGAAKDALDHKAEPPLWIRHNAGATTGPVIYLAEQYLP